MSNKDEGAPMEPGKFFAVIVIAAVTIAASDLDKFYHAVPHRTADVQTNVDPIAHPSSGDAKGDVAAMWSNGFELVGYSSFNGKEAGQKGVAKQARKVGASDVIYLERYTDTQNGGAVGSTSFTRWGAFSFISPMTVRRYDQLALYFRKAPRQGLGVYPRTLTDQEKVRIASNKGVAVIAVMNGSPAFTADILPGDIVVQVNRQPVWDAASGREAAESSKGKTVEVQIVRDGQPITKQVAIPVGDWQ